MDCEKMHSMLDAYIDDELSAEEERAFREHAQSCEACRSELEAAEFVRSALMHMDDEIVVPLEAQANWRNAVRAEAKKKNMRRWTRLAGGVAAALVLVVGCSAVLGGEDPMAGVVPLPEVAVVEHTDVLIASDGVAMEAAMKLNASEESYSAWKKISADDYDGAVAAIGALAEEYSGTFTVHADEPVLGARECICRIELPYEYMEDFLNAASRIGTELDSEIIDAEVETAVISIQIHEAGQE